MRKMFKHLRNDKGLTLVELLAVVVILAIIAGIAFVMIGNVMENAKKDAAIADALQIISAAKLYEVTENGLPGDEVAVATLQAEDGYLETLHDPWNVNNTYGEDAGNKVVKSSGVYSVTLDASGCAITGISETALLEGKRAEICNQ